MNCEQHQSHFEELKTKQKQEQKKFTQRLLHDLDLEKSQKVDKKAKNADKKFLSVDSVQNEPAPAHTHDPIRHHSPIPKEKRGVSSVEPPVAPTPQPQITKRASLETQQSLHNLFLHNMGLDPINPNIIGHHRSPIPNRKRGVNLVEQPVPPAPQPRRASLDTQQSQQNIFLHNMGLPHDHSATCAQYGLIRNICYVG